MFSKKFMMQKMSSASLNDLSAQNMATNNNPFKSADNTICNQTNTERNDTRQGNLNKCLNNAPTFNKQFLLENDTNHNSPSKNAGNRQVTIEEPKFQKKVTIENLLNTIAEKIMYASRVSLVGPNFLHAHKKPECREGAIMFLQQRHPRFGQCLVVQGGIGSKNFSKCNILQFDNYKWHSKKMDKKKQELSIKLYYHTIVKLSKFYVIYGGTMDNQYVSKASNMNTNVIILDPNTLDIWHGNVLSGQPTGRKYHVALTYKDSMIIHGGISGDDSVLSDYWSFSFYKNSTVKCNKLLSKSKCFEIDFGLAGHSAITYTDTTKKPEISISYIFGGFNSDRTETNNLYKILADHKEVITD